MTAIQPAARRDATESGCGLPIRLACTGCGYRLPDEEPVRLTCPMARAGDDVDHVLSRVLHLPRLRFPAGDDPNPFVRYRGLLYGYHAALAAGRTDDETVNRIRELDRGVAAIDGEGFRVTPFGRSARLSRRLGFAVPGGAWVKDETGNVSGSHKARHLFGTLLTLELAGGESGSRQRLAIASCGNAALAAAVVARAAGRELHVFIPPDAEPAVVTRLRELEAVITVCERLPGEAGDPTYRALLEAVRAGALPFTCQGNLNGLAIEGGLTLGWELVSQLLVDRQRLDHVVIQVGGGALASSIMQAFDEARELGVLVELPRMHTVQTRGAYPLARAHERVLAEIGPRPAPAVIEDALHRAARHRGRYMWPWETEPHSVATGILDDETYDWRAVMRGMLRTDGLPVVVDEATLVAANRVARASTGVDVDPTGSAGLAGVMELVRRGEIGPEQSVAVIFTGIRRQPPANGEHS